MTSRRSRRLRKMQPEWEPKAFEDCFFCLAPVIPFSKSAVPLQCCQRFVHRHCQVNWENTNREQCGYCRQELKRLFSLKEINRWSLVTDMQMLLEDDSVTQGLQGVGVPLITRWRLRSSLFYMTVCCFRLIR